MKHSPRRSARSFRIIDSLESRSLFSSVAPDLVAAGVEQIEWNGQKTYAKPGQFILRLDNVHGRADQQLNAVNNALGNVRNDAKATKFLGADGLTLVQTPKALTHGQL